MNYHQLTAADRGAIAILLHQEYKPASIARKLGVNRSTVCREIINRSTPAGYDPYIAHWQYETQRKRCHKRKKLQYSRRQKYICRKLALGWSPEQIAGRLKLRQSSLYVCKETLYQWLYTDPWAKAEKMYEYLRYGRKKRKQYHGRRVRASKIPNRVSIHDRPNVVVKRTEIGHWEGDSVIYPYKQAINTLNELVTGRVRFTKLERKTADGTAQAVIAVFKEEEARTVTFDNGTEFTKHEEITKSTGVRVYFADPFNSGQRGANENNNMLLRRYLPKRCDITHLTQTELHDIAEELNNRPRKRLGYWTPNEVWKYYQSNHQLPNVAVDSRI
jgi:transposase, IS30 family